MVVGEEMIAISTETAWTLRFERGLKLPTDRDYVDPRIADIAKRQGELFRQIAELDGQLNEIVDELRPSTAPPR